MLYVNGDSFTYGTGVEHSNTWAYLLSQRLGINLVNDAVPGSSNDRIVRTTLDSLAKYNPELVIIAWSSFLRTEWSSMQLEPMHLHEMDFDSRPIIQVQPNYDKYRAADRERIRSYYESLNLDWAMDRYLNQVLLLQSYLKDSKIRYVFVNALDNYSKEFYDKSKKSTNVGNEFLGWPDQCFNQWFTKEQRLPDGHLNELGHRALAEKLYKHVNDIRS